MNPTNTVADEEQMIPGHSMEMSGMISKSVPSPATSRQPVSRVMAVAVRIQDFRRETWSEPSEQTWDVDFKNSKNNFIIGIFHFSGSLSAERGIKPEKQKGFKWGVGKVFSTVRGL